MWNHTFNNCALVRRPSSPPAHLIKCWFHMFYFIYVFIYLFIYSLDKYINRSGDILLSFTRGVFITACCKTSLRLTATSAVDVPTCTPQPPSGCRPIGAPSKVLQSTFHFLQAEQAKNALTRSTKDGSSSCIRGSWSPGVGVQNIFLAIFLPDTFEAAALRAASRFNCLAAEFSGSTFSSWPIVNRASRKFEPIIWAEAFLLSPKWHIKQ